nr:MAG TPA: hypothetical protein [Caudoviricetes sp.]
MSIPLYRGAICSPIYTVCGMDSKIKKKRLKSRFLFPAQAHCICAGYYLTGHVFFTFFSRFCAVFFRFYPHF